MDQTPQNTQDSQDPGVDAGEQLVNWEAWEFPPMERSKRWYLTIVLVIAGLIAYALFTSNPLFALIVLMIGVLMIVNSTQQPKRVEIHITTGGVVVGSRFYEYDDLKDFSIIYKPPYSTVLYIDFKRWWIPLKSIELENADPLAIRDALLPVLPENIEREDEILTDVMKKVYKL